MKRSEETVSLANQGIALWKTGKPNEAIKILIPLARNNPSDAALQALVGFVYCDAEQFVEAIPHLEKAIFIKPRYALAVRALFHCLWELGEYQRGLVVVRNLAAISEDPEDQTMLADIEAEYGTA